MNKKIVRIPIEEIGDVMSSYCMIDYHMEFTKVVNSLLKSNNIDFKLTSMSYGGEKIDNDWRILFELKKQTENETIYHKGIEGKLEKGEQNADI
jgi:hypothetical protein